MGRAWRVPVSASSWGQGSRRGCWSRHFVSCAPQSREQLEGRARSPFAWDLANPEARKGVAPAVAGGMPQSQGTLQAAGTGRSHFPRTGPVGWRGVGALAGRPLRRPRQHAARGWVQTRGPSRGTSTRPAAPRRVPAGCRAREADSSACSSRHGLRSRPQLPRVQLPGARLHSLPSCPAHPGRSRRSREDALDEETGGSDSNTSLSYLANTASRISSSRYLS